MNISGYTFEGSWALGQEFNNVPGIYVIFTDQVWLDVGETDQLGNRINGENHDRKPDWIRHSQQRQINIAFLREASSDARLRIEAHLRSVLNPVCGER